MAKIENTLELTLVRRATVVSFIVRLRVAAHQSPIYPPTFQPNVFYTAQWFSD